MASLNTRRQQGVALPVMLIMLVVMLVGSIYLLKSSNSSTISAANMAYDDQLSKAADLGLQAAFQYLQTRANNNKADMSTDSKANGYLSSYDPTVRVSDPAFWTNAFSMPSSASMPFTIQYVMHRACLLPNTSYDSTSCMQTSANPLATGSPVPIGTSFAMGSAKYNSAPQIHYIITARIYGPRGGYVVNQMVALIDA